MRKNDNDISIEEVILFLEEKLSAHSDNISIEQYDHLFRIDKNKIIIVNALEYASDASILLDDIVGMNALIESVGNKIDTLQTEYDKNVSYYTPDKKKQMETMLRDLQIVHFGLIAVLMVKRY